MKADSAVKCIRAGGAIVTAKVPDNEVARCKAIMSGHALTSLAARRPTGALAGRAMIHPRLPMTRTKFAVKANLLELDGRNIGERPRLSEAAVFISRGENRLLPARAASNWTRGRLHPDHESHRHRAGRSSLRSGRFGLALHHTTPHHTTPHHTTPHHTPRPPYGNFSTWLNLKIRLHIYT
jgi:hypothetical protein